MTGRRATFTLPFPASTNNLFANTGNGRAKTAAYRAWRKAALAELLAQRVPGFPGRVAITLHASDQGLSHARDLDNLTKAPIDLLVKCGILAADNHRHVRSIALEWSAELPDGTCEVRIEEISPEPLPKPAPRRAPHTTAVADKIMRALRAKGIRVAPQRIRIQSRLWTQSLHSDGS
jgi:Holliday junction resolvase RusA-like endonuclease